MPESAAGGEAGEGARRGCGTLRVAGTMELPGAEGRDSLLEGLRERGAVMETKVGTAGGAAGLPLTAFLPAGTADVEVDLLTPDSAVLAGPKSEPDFLLFRVPFDWVDLRAFEDVTSDAAVGLGFWRVEVPFRDLPVEGETSIID